MGDAEAPVVGPAKMVFADCDTKDVARVPVVVTGDPVTLKKEGTVSATLVTPVFPTTIPLVAGVMTIPVPAVTPKSPPLDWGAMLLIVATRSGMHEEASVEVHVFPEMSTQLLGRVLPRQVTALTVNVPVDCKFPNTALAGKHEASSAPPGQVCPEMSTQSLESGPVVHCIVPFRASVCVT